MKKFCSVTLTAFLFFYSTEAQLKMSSDGNVGIGSYGSGDPGNELVVWGQMYITCQPGTSSGFNFTSYSYDPALLPQWDNNGWIGNSNYTMYKIYSTYLYYDYLIDFSDISIKENIRNIENPLASICQLKGIKYDLKEEYFSNSREDRMEDLIESGKNKYGMIAQEMKEVLPDLVTFNEEAELYGVNYVGMIPIMVEAIKEQQQEITSLQNQLSDLMNESQELKSSMIASKEDFDQNSDVNTLFQNTPNPFDNITIIGFFLTEEIVSATIYVYDMNGRQLRSFELKERGMGEVQINGGELEAGMYIYTLITDGQVVGSNQMILTK